MNFNKKLINVALASLMLSSFVSTLFAMEPRAAARAAKVLDRSLFRRFPVATTVAAVSAASGVASALAWALRKAGCIEGGKVLIDFAGSIALASGTALVASGCTLAGLDVFEVSIALMGDGSD